MSTLGIISYAFAEEAAPIASVGHKPTQSTNSNSTEGSLMANLTPLIAIMVVFYFLLIRPQQRKLREHQALVKTLKRGDQVLTMGGVVGVVQEDHDDSYVALEIAKDVVIQIKRESIGEVISEAKKEKSNANPKTIKPTSVTVKKAKAKERDPKKAS